MQVDTQTGQLSLKLNNARIKSLRITYDSANGGGTKISKVFVAERPLTYNEIVDEGNRSVGTNCVFLGTVLDNATAGTSSSATPSSSTTNRTTTNFDVKQYKNIFVVFKNLDVVKKNETVNTVRYESEGMSYLLIDSSATVVPELREINYPVTVYTTNAMAQQKLIEFNYVQVNDNATLFIKNHRNFRVQ
ncbi:Odv-e25 [Apocheima cinerarium nucleopolyhedrovirus]|uniref:Odv-e25 n=1 Tax=Apocheima cinerarium nucleopolyhedrovirus TaxID=307461 RepID=UPI0001D92094|nr:Odv-e25 [Apocheima cinerarium nucleopolyhedrovirus]ADB84422.1 Odv-e25 [Apocheima cinerarium nucleopolyhedrovirus]